MNHDTPKVVTNNHWRQVLSRCELTGSERAEQYPDYDSFIRYRGITIPLDEFLRVADLEGWNAANSLVGWDGVFSISYYNAVVVRLHDTDPDLVQVGTVLV